MSQFKRYMEIIQESKDLNGISQEIIDKITPYFSDYEKFSKAFDNKFLFKDVSYKKLKGGKTIREIFEKYLERKKDLNKLYKILVEIMLGYKNEPNKKNVFLMHIGNLLTPPNAGYQRPEPTWKLEDIKILIEEINKFNPNSALSQ